MAKYELKTRPTDASVDEFLNSVADKRERHDSFRVREIMERVTGEKPVMWGPAIVGFGSHCIKYSNGTEMDWPCAAFSPRKGALTLYFMPGFQKFDELLSKIGKYKTGKSCFYIKRLSDVDEAVLEELISASVEQIEQRSLTL